MAHTESTSFDNQKPFFFYTDKIELKADAEGPYVEGWISNAEMDLVRDIVTPNCFKSMERQGKSRTIKIDIEHETLRGRDQKDIEFNKTIIPAGKCISIEARGQEGAYVRAPLNQNYKRFDEKGNLVMDYKDVDANIKNGYYDAFSIAFYPVKTKIVKDANGDEVRLLEDIHLINIALTGNPVNTGAKIVKFGGAIAKSLEYMKDQESNAMNVQAVSKSTDFWTFQTSDETGKKIQLLESEIKEIKSKLEVSTMNKENKDVSVEEKEQPIEVKSQPTDAHAPALAAVTAPVDQSEVLQKALEAKNAEMAQLSKQLEELKGRVSENEKALNTPMMKGMGAEPANVKAEAETPLLQPFDLIR